MRIIVCDVSTCSHVLRTLPLPHQTGGFNSVNQQTGARLAEGAGDERLDDGPAVVVEEVDLVDDEEAHERGHGDVAALACDDVPLLRRRDNHLRRRQLRLGELHVSRKLAHLHVRGEVCCWGGWVPSKACKASKARLDAERLEARAEGARDLGGEGLHGRDVHDLEAVLGDGAICLPVLRELVQYRHHRDVGLARARGRADEHVLVRVEPRLHASVVSWFLYHQRRAKPLIDPRRTHRT